MTAFFFLNDLRFKSILPVYLKKYYSCIFRCLLVLCTLLYVDGVSSSVRSQGKVDSLKQLIDNDTVINQGEVYLNLFVQYRISNTDSAIYFASRSSQVSREEGDSLTYVRAEYALGWGYQRIGIWQQAISHYSKAVFSARNNGYEEREKSALNGLAISYNYNGQYDQSLKHHFESLDLREKNGNKKDMAISLNNIGLVYFQIKDYDKAIQYFQRALKLDEEIGAKDVTATLVNLGLCFSAKGLDKDALEKYERVLDLCDVNCDPSMLIDAYNGAGNAYKVQSEYDLAEHYFTTAREIAVNENLKSQFVISMHNLSKLWLLKQNYEKSLVILDESQDAALEVNFRVFINENYKLYGEIHSKLGNYQLAFEYQSKYDSLNSSIMNEEVIRNLAQTQAEFQERENLETISQQEDELGRRTALIYLSLIILALVSIIGLILWRNNRSRQRVNRELSYANDTIERQNRELTDVNNVLEEKVKDRTKELKTANAALIKSNTDLDTFIYKTSHDIRGPLATLQGMCNVAIIDIVDPKALDYFQKLGKTADRLNEILSKLLVINQINNSIICIEEVNINEMVDDVINESKLLSNGSELEVRLNIDASLIFGSDKDLIKIIFNNLVNNAYKFYNSSDRVQSFVQIDANRNGKAVDISVVDNGIGIDEKGADKIFEIFSKASEVADSAGLGLYLVKLAIEKLEGEIHLSKTSEGHTAFNVKLPLV